MLIFKNNLNICISLIFLALFSGCQTTKFHELKDRNGVKQRIPHICEVQKNNYKLKYLKKEPDRPFYYTTKRANFKVINGFDISRHQGVVDFQKLKDDGYEFVIIRLAYRRYGKNSGELVKEERFDEYFQGAKDAGLKIGLYVFSQAINIEEALEEAQIVIDSVNPEDLDLPVAYDPEFIYGDEARTDDVPEEQFNLNTIAFCEKIKEAGFTPMIYTNVQWEVFVYSPETLNNYDLWLCQYLEKPETPYKFTFWQYSGTTKIDSIENICDMDLMFLPLED